MPLNGVELYGPSAGYGAGRLRRRHRGRRAGTLYASGRRRVHRHRVGTGRKVGRPRVNSYRRVVHRRPRHRVGGYGTRTGAHRNSWIQGCRAEYHRPGNTMSWKQILISRARR